MESYYQVLKVNLKHNLKYHLLVILLLFLLSPYILGMSNLDESQVAQIVEVYVSIFGIIMLVPLFIPDEDLSIRYLIETKKQSMLKTHLIRLFEQITILILEVVLFMLILRFNDCSFDFIKLFYASFSNCIFLGGLGILSYSIINSATFAYMIPIFYYVFNYGGGKDFVGKFYIFYMSSGKFDTTIYILIAGIVMTVLGIIYRDFIIKYLGENY